MYCVDCGLLNSETAKFCRNCGQEILPNQSEIIQLLKSTTPLPAQSTHDEITSKLPPESSGATYGEIAYAGFLRRLMASFIDVVILFLILFAMVVILGENVVGFFFLLVPLVYGCLLEGSKWNATIGKKLLSIAVKNVDGESVSYGRALCRNLLKSLFFLVALIVYIYGVQILGPFKAQSYEEISYVAMRSSLLNLIIGAIFWLWMFGPRINSNKRQSLHDILTGTVIVRKQRNHD